MAIWSSIAPGDEDDPLAQQPRKDVEAALAPVGLLDDDGDELRNDVLMIGHVKLIPDDVALLHRREGERFKRPSYKKGRPGVPDRPPFHSVA